MTGAWLQRPCPRHLCVDPHDVPAGSVTVEHAARIGTLSARD
jgi:hypothetical protein